MPAELVEELNRLAGTGGLEAAGAANAWAGSTALELVGALNDKAGTIGLELEGAIREITRQHGGNSGLSVVGMLVSIAGGGVSGDSLLSQGGDELATEGGDVLVLT